MKNYIKSLLDKWPLLLSYCVSILALILLIYLKSLSFELILDYIRLTWLFIFGGLIISTLSEARKLIMLKKDKLPRGNSFLELGYEDYIDKQKIKLNEIEHRLQSNYENRADYLKVWSHEIKTPLAALSLLSQTKEQIPANEVRHQVDIASYQLNLLLNYERMADFNHDLEFRQVDLLELIQDVIQKNMNFFINKNISFQIDVEPVKVITDAKWLAFIIEQLLINAAKYSSINKIIKINYLEGQLEIIDQGIGISASDLPRIFEPGFTGKNGRKYGAATGMGLYIVKRMSHKLNLSLEVSSVLQQGTTVKLKFN
ncbi:sensor histidine kinase [Lactobacillus salivarius]|uniref:histidine kinase n=1 Tax=Ligilactobacillus salivarius TaxID=1624 RepID=A0A7X2SRK6_9LACO|nr:sensor histidine kinase [Ligilactobacillus salivarius]